MSVTCRSNLAAVRFLASLVFLAAEGVGLAQPRLSAETSYHFTELVVHQVRDDAVIPGDAQATHQLMLSAMGVLPLDRIALGLSGKLNLGVDDSVRVPAGDGEAGSSSQALRLHPELIAISRYRLSEIVSLSIVDRMAVLKVLNADRSELYEGLAEGTLTGSVEGMEGSDGSPVAGAADTGSVVSMLLTLPREGLVNELVAALSQDPLVQTTPGLVMRHRLSRLFDCTPADVLPVLGLPTGSTDVENQLLEAAGQLRYGLSQIAALELRALGRLEHNQQRGECVEGTPYASRFATVSPTLAYGWKGESLEAQADAGAAIAWQRPDARVGRGTSVAGRPVAGLGVRARRSWLEAGAQLRLAVETGIGQAAPTQQFLLAAGVSVRPSPAWSGSLGLARLQNIELFPDVSPLPAASTGTTLAGRLQVGWQPLDWLLATAAYIFSSQQAAYSVVSEFDGTEQRVRTGSRVHAASLGITVSFDRWLSGQDAR